MDQFREKVVFITGGSSGIGRSAALRLARHGAHLVLAARSPGPLAEVEKEAIHLGAKVLTIPTDVADAQQVERAVAKTVERFGKLDILISSAGVSLRQYFEYCTLETLEKVMRVNFFGTLYATHFALPHLIKTRGSLVAISSLTGQRGIPSYSLYGASKFGVTGLYDALRLEVRRHGVHVGVVSPGFVDTPLRTSVLAGNGQSWPEPPVPPFRIWPVEKCVDRLMNVLERRKAQSLIPWWTGPLLKLDGLIGSWIGNWVLRAKFPPDKLPRETASG